MDSRSAFVAAHFADYRLHRPPGSRYHLGHISRNGGLPRLAAIRSTMLAGHKFIECGSVRRGATPRAAPRPSQTLCAMRLIPADALPAAADPRCPNHLEKDRDIDFPNAIIPNLNGPSDGTRPRNITLIEERLELFEDLHRQKGAVEKVAELDREPQVKLGWKVVQMVRRALFSDRANQLRQVQADNIQRRAAAVDIDQLRVQLARRQEEGAARRREADQKKLLERSRSAGLRSSSAPGRRGGRLTSGRLEEGEEIVKAKRYLGVIEGNRDHFQKFWDRENETFQRQVHEREQGERHRRHRDGDRDGRGWSR
jgi:hypothetical protein